MSRGKKYGVRTRQDSDGFTAEVIRRRTSRGTTVERARGGFQSHEEAKAWADGQLAEYLALRQRRAAAKKARRAGARKARAEVEAWLDAQTLQGLAQAVQSNTEHARAAQERLKSKVELLWREVAFRVLKNGASEHVACSIANEEVGKRWGERLQKALQGELDRVDKGVSMMALENARRLLEEGLAWAGRNAKPS